MKMFDKQKATGLLYAAYRNCGIGFCSSFLKGVRLRHLVVQVAFFVPFFHQLVSWVQETKVCRVYLLERSANLHSTRLSPFCSGFGEYSKGASI